MPAYIVVPDDTPASDVPYVPSRLLAGYEGLSQPESRRPVRTFAADAAAGQILAVKRKTVEWEAICPIHRG